MKLLIFSILLLFLVLNTASALNKTNDCRCRARVASRVVGGRSANQTDWPWVVAIKSTLHRGNFSICSGSILNENWILTAASCLPHQNDHESINTIKVQLNAVQNLADVDQVVLHPLFKLANFTADNDIALIKLKKSLDFKKVRTIQPACLEEKKLTGKNDFNMTFVGFGSVSPITMNSTTGDIKGFRPTKILKEGTLHDFTYQDPACKNRKKNTMCVKNRVSNDSFCLGDTGGPLHKSNQYGHSVFGVASIPTPEFAKNQTIKLCTKGTRVALVPYYLGWIKMYVHSDYCTKFQG